MNDIFFRSEWIGKFTDNELDQEQEINLLLMASENPLLRNELRMDREISEMFTDRKKAELSEMICNTIRNRKKIISNSPWLKIAAVVTILVASSSLIQVMRNHFSKTEDKITQEGMFTAEKETRRLFSLPNLKQAYEKTFNVRHKQLARVQSTTGNYMPIPEYELLTGANIRDQMLFLISPYGRLQCCQDSVITFNWHFLSECKPVIIEICDNQGKCVLKSEPLTKPPFIIQANFLQKGLYYYKVLNKDDLITMGSICIK